MMDMLEGAASLPRAPVSDRLFMGIDPSLTATGVAAMQGGRLKTFLLSPKTSGAARLSEFYTEFIGIFQRYAPSIVALEGYAFGAQSRQHALGELGGVLRLALTHTSTPFVVVPPTSLKMFVTGKGVGDKSVISKELFKRYGVDLTDNNEVDAAALALAGMAFSGIVNDLPQTHRRALDKLVIEHPALVRVRQRKS